MTPTPPVDPHALRALATAESRVRELTGEVERLRLMLATGHAQRVNGDWYRVGGGFVCTEEGMKNYAEYLAPTPTEPSDG